MKKPSQKTVMRAVEELEAAGKLEEAAAKLIEATQKFPDDATLSARLILIYSRRLNAPRKAAAEMTRLLKLAPTSPVTHELAAEIALNVNAFAQAKKHADEMVRLRTTSPDGLYIGATIYQKLSLHERAILCLKEALRLRPNHLQSRLLLVDLEPNHIRSQQLHLLPDLNNMGDHPSQRQQLAYRYLVQH